MKLKHDFALRQVADAWVVLSFADANVNFNGMLSLNESGALLWRILEQGGDREALIRALTTEYNVPQNTAAGDVDAFIEKLTKAGCLQ